MREINADVREMARQNGGEEMVAKLDEANALEQKLTKAIDAMLTEALDGKEGIDLQLTVACLNEVIADVAGRMAVKYGEITSTDDPTIMILAVKALSAAIRNAISDRDTAKGGVLEKIMGAISGEK